MNSWVIVFAGGGLGSVARFGLASVFGKYFYSSFPISTLLSNVLSCSVFALTLVLFSDKLMAQPSWRLFIITGFCGGFSTFSAFSFETVQLIRTDHLALAIVNIVLSMGICFAVFFMLVKNT